MPEWYASTDQEKISENPVFYICKSRSISKIVFEICNAGSITIEQESFLLGYPHCCVQDHYFKHQMMNQGFGLMLHRIANGDESEMIRLVREDVSMSAETDEEIECMTEATRIIAAPYTSIVMCPSCEEHQDSPARLISKSFKHLAEPGFSIASDICDRVHLAGIPHVGTDPRGKACQNRSGLASRLLLTVGVGHVRDRGGWGPWRRPILGSTRHSRRTGPVIGQR